VLASVMALEFGDAAKGLIEAARCEASEVILASVAIAKDRPDGDVAWFFRLLDL
jgi:hypothetical protein